MWHSVYPYVNSLLEVSWLIENMNQSHKNTTLIMTTRTGVYVIIWRASFFKLSTSPVDLTLSVRPLLCRDDLLTRVIPQEAKDKALQALLGEPSAQAGGGCKDDHDHEGRKHQPDHHTGAQRHCESPPSHLPANQLLALVWASSCVICFSCCSLPWRSQTPCCTRSK